MANFFKKLFGKGKTETPLSEDSILNGLPDNVAFLNKCICATCLKGDNISNHRTEIENFFPNEPTLFSNVAALTSMLKYLSDSPLLTGKALSDFKNKAKAAHIDEKIDYIISENKRNPQRDSSVPQGNELDRYALAFMLVPLLVETYNEAIHDGGVSPGGEDLFWDTTIWKRIAGTMDYTRTDFDWNEISFQKHQIGQKLCVAITFPKPLKVPQAKYGLVVIDKEAHYFTLEKASKVSSNDRWKIEGDENFWILGGVNNRKHINYGFREGNLTISQFIEEALGKN